MNMPSSIWEISHFQASFQLLHQKKLIRTRHLLTGPMLGQHQPPLHCLKWMKIKIRKSWIIFDHYFYTQMPVSDPSSGRTFIWIIAGLLFISVAAGGASWIRNIIIFGYPRLGYRGIALPTMAVLVAHFPIQNLLKDFWM